MIRNNLGIAQHALGRFAEALAEFKQVLVIREQGTDLGRIRIAHWMVAWTLRAIKRLDESIEIQLRLEQEWAAANAPDPFVFKELEALYRAKGIDERASHYASLRNPAAK